MQVAHATLNLNPRWAGAARQPRQEPLLKGPQQPPRSSRGGDRGSKRQNQHEAQGRGAAEKAARHRRGVLSWISELSS